MDSPLRAARDLTFLPLCTRVQFSANLEPSEAGMSTESEWNTAYSSRIQEAGANASGAAAECPFLTAACLVLILDDTMRQE